MTAAPQSTPYAECKIAMQRALAVSALAAVDGVGANFQFRPASIPIDWSRHDHESPVGAEAQCTREGDPQFLHVADGVRIPALLDGATEGPVNMVRPRDFRGRTARRNCAADRTPARAVGCRSAPLLVRDGARRAALYGKVGWRPQFGLHDAIADTISWWRQRRAAHSRGSFLNAFGFHDESTCCRKGYDAV
jgi:nucleoside-diphosphate-sugar epimerase